MKGRLRITIITEYFPYSANVEIRGGVEARCFYLGRELAKRHGVTIITSWSKGLKREETINGMRVLRVGPHHEYTHHGLGAFVSRLGFAKAARETASCIPADIIEGANFISYLPAFAASRKQRVLGIATYHEVWLGSWIKNKGIITGVLGSIWERLVLAKPWNKIIAVSAFTKTRLLVHGIQEKMITVIPNGVDLREYQGKIKRNDQPTICCVSRLTPQKRVEDLIRAMAIVRKQISDAQCDIVGVGDEETSLKTLAARLGVDEAIHFHGFVKNHADVITVLKRSHVFCLPSVVEGFGIVVLEAMAAGVPYVCTDIPPLKEITANGNGGFLGEQKNPSDMAASIIKLLKDKKLYAQKVNEGLRHVQQYDWKDIAKRVEKTYYETCHEASKRP